MERKGNAAPYAQPTPAAEAMPSAAARCGEQRGGARDAAAARVVTAAGRCNRLKAVHRGAPRSALLLRRRCLQAEDGHNACAVPQAGLAARNGRTAAHHTWCNAVLRRTSQH